MSTGAGIGPLRMRLAQVSDAPSLARIYVEAWREAYAGILPDDLLVAMSRRRQEISWRRLIESGRLARSAAARQGVLIAELKAKGPVALASFGRARDRGLPYDGEVYALYVDPNYIGRGIGRRLLSESFRRLAEWGAKSCVVWALEGAPSRFFYQAMGGRLIARREGKLGGKDIAEIGFGWPELKLRMPETSADS